MKTGQLFTLGQWKVKPGQEEAFIEAWAAFARWTAEHYKGAGTGSLLQDSQRAGEFVSFGAWESPEQVSAWRASPEFKAFGETARRLCDEFQPRSLRLVASSASPRVTQ